MNHTTKLYGHAQLIAHARLTTTRVHFATGTTQSCGGHIQKAVLLALAATEGELVTIETLSGMASTSFTSCWRALLVLRQLSIAGWQGEHPVRRRAGRYRIDWEELAKHVPADQVARLTRQAARERAA